MVKQSNRIRDALEIEILSGDLSPGDRLDEVRLARKFEVSRTPVREALKELAAEGLVESRPRRGVVVTSISLHQILEMYEVLAEMEGFCAHLAARRMDQPERQNLADLHGRMKSLVETNDWNGYFTMDEELHRRIHAGSHNDFLISEVRAIRNRMAPYRRLYMKLPRRVEEPYDEHTTVVEAILAQDDRAAAVAMKSHASIRADGISDFIAAFNQQFPKISA